MKNCISYLFRFLLSNMKICLMIWKEENTFSWHCMCKFSLWVVRDLSFLDGHEGIRSSPFSQDRSDVFRPLGSWWRRRRRSWTVNVQEDHRAESLGKDKCHRLISCWKAIEARLIIFFCFLNAQKDQMSISRAHKRC